MSGVRVTEPLRGNTKKLGKGSGKKRWFRLVTLSPRLLMRPFYLWGRSLDRWFEDRTPSWLKAWDNKRYSRTAVDRFLYWCRWLAVCLFFAAVFLPRFFPQVQGLRTELVMGALIIFPVTYAVKRKFSTEEENRSADERESAHKKRYRRSSRIMHRTYYVLAFFTGGTFLAAVTRAMDQETTWGHTILVFGMVVPLVMAIGYSQRLMKLGVSDLEYVKGTTTCREVAVYWLVTTGIVMQGLLAGEQDFRASPALAAAITFVALARIWSTGYKEFREAIGSAPEATESDDMPLPRNQARQSSDLG